MSLSSDAEVLTKEERVEATYNVIEFYGGVEERDVPVYGKKEQKAIDEDSKLRMMITSARNNVPTVEISTDQVLYICKEASRAGCEGQRGEIFATEIAKTCAAIDGRRNVNAADLQTAVRLALLHRSKYFIDDSGSTMEEGVEDKGSDMTPIQPSPGEQGSGNIEEAPADKTSLEGSEMDQNLQEDNDEIEEESPLAQEEEDEFLAIPEEFMFGVNMVPLDPKLLSFMARVKKGKGGKRSKQFNLERGR